MMKLRLFLVAGLLVLRAELFAQDTKGACPTHVPFQALVCLCKALSGTPFGGVRFSAMCKP